MRATYRNMPRPRKSSPAPPRNFSITRNSIRWRKRSWHILMLSSPPNQRRPDFPRRGFNLGATGRRTRRPMPARLLRKCGGQCPPYAPHLPVGPAVPAVFVCRCPAQTRDDSEYGDLWHASWPNRRRRGHAASALHVIPRYAVPYRNIATRNEARRGKNNLVGDAQEGGGGLVGGQLRASPPRCRAMR